MDDIAILEELRDWLRKREIKCRENAVQLAEVGDDDYLAWADMEASYKTRADAIDRLLTKRAKMTAQLERLMKALEPFSDFNDVFPPSMSDLEPVTYADADGGRDLMVKDLRIAATIFAEFDDRAVPQPPKATADE